MKFDGTSIIGAFFDGIPLKSVYFDDVLVWGMFKYTLLTDKTYEISPMNKSSLPNNLVIPNEYMGQPVTRVSGFSDCYNLHSVTIPDSVTHIARSTFSDCIFLSDIVIGNHVTDIGSYAFSNCDDLTYVFYKGTASGWDDISIGDWNSSLTHQLSTKLHYYSQSAPTSEGNYWHYVDGVPTIWIPETHNLVVNIGTASYKMVGSGSMTSGKVASISNCPRTISSIQKLEITVIPTYTYTGYIQLSLGSWTNANCTLTKVSADKYTLTITGATGDVSVQINGTAP